MKKGKRKKWMRFRHRVVRNVAYAVLYPYTRIKYGFKPQRFKEQGGRQYLILLNHQTPFDQFFVGMCFKGPVYYLATEDIFSKGFVSSAIRWLIAPIPIKKQTTDASAVINCLRVAREGGTICIAPEGNRTYSGRTEYMSPTIAPLARRLKLPIAIYRIEGGYGAEPRWSDVVRKGKVRGYVSRVIEPEEYALMSDDELYDAIRTELFVDEAVADMEFRHKRSAEYLERVMYVCPKCGLSEFESHKDTAHCKKCGLSLRYMPDKTLLGTDGAFPFRFLADWYDYQKDYINSLSPEDMGDDVLYTDKASLIRVIPYEKKEVVSKDALFRLYRDRVEIEMGRELKTLHFDEISTAAALGRNKLNLYHGDDIWQVKGDKRFNPVKYVNLYYRYANIQKGDENGKFLGL
ncbi:MAG: 1-acyl-sn-glycerol-3-phosphate acyltransferase [Clostridia bacterium]|nr:1-acyl-sn-glycerol-3-phosphate acyltransferase [Clostridia bacterium]